MSFPPARFERKIAERQKGNERHVVGHDHGTEIGNENQREYDVTHVFELTHDNIRRPHEKTDVFERRHDGERAKKTGQRAQIEIRKVFPVRRHEKTRSDRGGKRDDENYVVFERAGERAGGARLRAPPRRSVNSAIVMSFLSAAAESG